MLKLSPTAYQRLVQAHLFSVEYSGAEANVAVSLSNFGIPTSLVSAVPDNALGEAAINALRQYGVDTTNIIKNGERLGIYFAEKGASQRPSMVIYDRKNSAIASSSVSDFDWNIIFDGAEWFHLTGITPALSDSLAAICLEACRVAKGKGIIVSCDLNYRKKLWSREKARAVMTDICKYVDVCIANEEDASYIFDINSEKSDINKGTINEQSYTSVARQLQHLFGFKYVAITLRESISASDNNWSAILLHGQQVYYSPKYAIHIIDRIGGGDSFSAALIFSLLNDYETQYALDFSVATSCLKQTIEGDFNHVSVSEVESLVSGNGSGRIQR